MGKVLDGDWDALDHSFEQLDFYQAAATVRHNGGTWSTIPVAQQALSRVGAGRADRKRQTGEQFYAQLEDAMEDLCAEIGETGRVARPNHDSVSVHVGRHGDLLLSRGQRWLTLAKLLDLPRIPVAIAIRHRQWVDFKHEILDYVSRHGRAYAPLLHPDLEWIPSAHGHERFEVIRQALIAQGGSVLDIGCHWGYFCHRLEDLGFDCVGVEANPRHYRTLEKLKRAGNKDFRTVNGSIFEYIRQEPRPYDVVLALSVFHHFAKSKDTLQQLKGLLASLQMREMYFQPHQPSGRQMQNAYWNPTENEFVSFVLAHSVLQQATHLGRSRDGRSIYRLTTMQRGMTR
jgi:hypothetical protein